MCFRFLCNPSKDADLRKWAAEGLAYLTLDADVKQELVSDKDAVVAMLDLAKVQTGCYNRESFKKKVHVLCGMPNLRVKIQVSH